MSFLEKRYIQIICIVFVAIISYSNTFSAPFTFDSIFWLQENPYQLDIKDINNFLSQVVTGIKHGGRFIGFLTFAIDYKIGGLSVLPYHITNLIIHIVCGILVYFLVLQTVKTPYFTHLKKESEIKQLDYITPVNTVHTKHYGLIALFSALLFVSHPIQTQAVTYIIQRFTSLATMFYLFSLILYINGRLRIEMKYKQTQDNEINKITVSPFSSILKTYGVAILYFLVSLIFAVLAFRTKEMAITLPISIVCYELFFFRVSLKKRLLFLAPLFLIIIIVPLWVLSGGQSIREFFLNIFNLKIQTDMPRTVYLITQFRVMVTYIRLIFLPINQSIDYDYEIYNSFFVTPVILSFLFIMALLGLSFYLLYYSSKKGSFYARCISFGILWFFITQSPNAIIPSVDVIVEHRLYLPLVGFSFAMAFASDVILKKLKSRWYIFNKLGIVAAVCIIAILTITTFVRNTVWKSEISLWEDVVEQFPNNARALNNLSAAYIDAGRYLDAIEKSRRTLTLAPGNTNAYNNIGFAYFKLGMLQEARDAFEEAIRYNPDSTEIYSNLVVVCIYLGDYKRAIEASKEVIRRAPSAFAYNNLGISYLRLNMINDAISSFRKSLELKPDYKEALDNLNNVMSMNRRN